jgi:hypothetical protein
MEATPSVETMIAVVQDYIYQKKGKKVRIIFDNPMSLRKHLIMLNEAYNIAISNNTNTK